MTVIEKYKVGDTTSGGETISHIFGCNEIAIVFYNSDDLLRWETTCENNIFSTAVDKFYSLDSQIPSTLPEEIKMPIETELASALHHAFSCEKPDEIDKFFQNVEKRISLLLSPNQAKLWLVLYGLSSSVAIILLLLFISRISSSLHLNLFLCGGAGVLGSTISLMQRNTKVSINLEDGKGYIFLQAAFIPILGLFSGLCLYLLSNSDLAFSFAKNNIYNLMSLSIVAGFSERYIPDLFQKVSK